MNLSQNIQIFKDNDSTIWLMEQCRDSKNVNGFSKMLSMQ